MGRVHAILGRFPAHLEASKPGKLLGQVSAALARGLDVQSVQMARIRRAHRLFEAEELADLLLNAARHGIGADLLALLALRFDRAESRERQLLEAGDAQSRLETAETLLALWGLETQGPRLGLFVETTSGDGPPDLAGPEGEEALGRLMSVLQSALSRRALLNAARSSIAAAVAIHVDGNATVRALLHGAANALAMDLGAIRSSPDRYLHAAFGLDRLTSQLAPSPGESRITPAREVIGLEENPRYRVQTDNMPRRHAELFEQLRRGFEHAALRVIITGESQHSHGPMLVNRDEGHGVGYAGQVPPGANLVFEEGGRVTLDEVDVTSFSYAWRGACFADADNPHGNDFVFAAEGPEAGTFTASFAVGVPAKALDSDFVFPHGGDSLPMPGVAVGRTRFAFFVQEAHHSVAPHPPGAPTGRRVPPRPAVGFFDASVFAPGPAEDRGPAAWLALSWLERKAHFVRLLIPPRFRLLEDDPEGPEVRRRLALAVDRFKPAGVAVQVDFIDDRWTLGQGSLSAADARDPVAVLRGGTVLWGAPEAP